MFYWTQSALKDFEREDVCPRKWKAKWIDKSIKSQSTEAMDKGKYFEYLAIGAGAIYGEEVTDLPRTSKGAKTIDQIRIEEQAELCKKMFDPNCSEFIGLIIDKVQTTIKHEDEKGTLDIEGINVKSGNKAIVDLKLTLDVNNQRGPYGWGNGSSIDFTQQIHYRNLYYRTTGNEPENIVLVFDYSPRKGVKRIDVELTDYAIAQVESRFDSAKAVYRQYEEIDWSSEDPSESECSDCPLQCSRRYVKPLLIEERYVI